MAKETADCMYYEASRHDCLWSLSGGNTATKVFLRKTCALSEGGAELLQ